MILSRIMLKTITKMMIATSAATSTADSIPCQSAINHATRMMKTAPAIAIGPIVCSNTDRIRIKNACWFSIHLSTSFSEKNDGKLRLMPCKLIRSFNAALIASAL